MDSLTIPVFIFKYLIEGIFHLFNINLAINFYIYPVESDADTTDSLKLENKKLRTQVESLKAIAEQNTSLMWSMQSYQHQAEDISQQYSNMIAAKDYEVL